MLVDLAMAKLTLPRPAPVGVRLAMTPHGRADDDTASAPLTPLQAAVIVALPVPTPDTAPPLTLAIVASELDQVNDGHRSDADAPASSVAAAESANASPM